MLSASLRSLESLFNVAQQLAEDVEADPRWLCVGNQSPESEQLFSPHDR